MKLRKMTFLTPITGSIVGEELFADNNHEIFLDSQQVNILYETKQIFSEYFEELQDHLEELQEGITESIPEELKDAIVKAVFGNITSLGGSLYFRTEIYTREEAGAGEELMDSIKEWIKGQMSDGWGEEIEQAEVTRERVEYEVPYFCTVDMCIQKDQRVEEVYYYLHPWNSENWDIQVFDIQKVELTKQELGIELELSKDIQVFHSAATFLPSKAIYEVLTVYKFKNIDDINLFLLDSYSYVIGSKELVDCMKDNNIPDNLSEYYIQIINAGMDFHVSPLVATMNTKSNTARIYKIDSEKGTVTFEEYANELISQFHKIITTR